MCEQSYADVHRRARDFTGGKKKKGIEKPSSQITLKL